MTCLICKINGCACLFAEPKGDGKKVKICLLCAGAPVADERKVEIEALRKSLDEKKDGKS
jgi:hypothetical protein